MSTSAKFDNAFTAINFMLAGSAKFTLVSVKTGARYTYQITKSEDGGCYFVSVMYGPNNEADFTYMGIIRRKTLCETQKSKVKSDDIRFKAFKWAFEGLVAGTLSQNLEIWHEGTCGRCNRALTVPSSIASGLGSECAKRMFKAEAA